jgi:hypothetical protein
MASVISDEQWCQYHRDGYLRLGKLLSDDDIDALQRRIDQIMLGQAPVDYEHLLMQLDGETGRYEQLPPATLGFKSPTLNYRKIEYLEFDPLFLAYMKRPVFGEICAYIYGPHASIACYRAMFMNKPARKGTILPWHQDAGDSWDVDRDPLVTVWTALDPATMENGCVQIIPGSHRLGLLSDEGHTITPEQAQRHCPEGKIIYLELQPGEAVLLHNWLLHRSDVNRTATPRRAFSVCYIDARTRSLQGNQTFSTIFGKNARVAPTLGA